MRENQYFPARSLFALRAVVELHQPDKEGGCKGCPYDAQWHSSTEEYPCETIQAIEKELQ
jgi:hypothetical protein